MKRLNAILIGGSNTVMRPGYAQELPKCLHPHGIDLRISANIPVGNTSIMMGLMQLKIHSDAIREADVLFIEYTLNDTSFFGSADGLMRWARVYEGVIRYARTINPTIKIVCIIFATKTGPHRGGINPLHAGVHYLCAHYDLAIADVNGEFVRRFGAGFYDQPGMYQDYAHYQRPVVTKMAAEVIAEKCGGYLGSDFTPQALPDSICDSDYASCGMIMNDRFPALPASNFKNYLYDVDTADLVGHRIKLAIEGGTILAARYICVEDAAQLYIGANGTWYHCQTLQSGLVTPSYKFLLCMLNLEVPQIDGLNHFTLTTVKPAGAKMTKLVQPGTKEPVRPERHLPLSGILHSGKLISVDVEKELEADLAEVS